MNRIKTLLNHEQRYFKRYYFSSPRPAKLCKDIFEQDILIHDLSLDGVCFSLKNTANFKLDHNVTIKLITDLPNKSLIEMKLSLVDAKFPIYRGMWNPVNEIHGVALTQWLKRIFGNEEQLYL